MPPCLECGAVDWEVYDPEALDKAAKMKAQGQDGAPEYDLDWMNNNDDIPF
jgi:hypothetical protein